MMCLIEFVELAASAGFERKLTVTERTRDLEQELLESIEEIRAYKHGEHKLRTRTFVQVSPPAVIRSRLNLSQDAFADQHPEAFLDLK